MNFQVRVKIEIHLYFILDISELRAVIKSYIGKMREMLYLCNVIVIFQEDQNIIGITISKDITEKILASQIVTVQLGQNKEDLP